MTAYYNENDKFAAAWLRELIKAGHIAEGEVDERSIEDIRPSDLAAFTQCHFFAGIGGWSAALRLARWSDDRPVWTGSCPCQPFSAAGKRGGFADERHLWPAWFHLIEQCEPDIIFGEQVAKALEWLDLVQSDLEGSGYAVESQIMGAHSVGAPHIRQRLWFVANRLAVADHNVNQRAFGGSNGASQAAEVEHGSDFALTGEPGGTSADVCGMGNTLRAAQERLERLSIQMEPEQKTGRSGNANPWANPDFIRCADGKSRPIESSVQPLAYGVPARLVRLRGYGNAIVPQVAAAFIESCA